MAKANRRFGKVFSKGRDFYVYSYESRGTRFLWKLKYEDTVRR